MIVKLLKKLFVIASILTIAILFILNMYSFLGDVVSLVFTIGVMALCEGWILLFAKWLVEWSEE